MSILALGRKQKSSQSKEWEKTKRENSQSNSERKQKRKKIPDQGPEENRRNMQKGLWARQYLNNTELSPPSKKRKETTT